MGFRGFPSRCSRSGPQPIPAQADRRSDTVEPRRKGAVHPILPSFPGRPPCALPMKKLLSLLLAPLAVGCFASPVRVLYLGTPDRGPRMNAHVLMRDLG